MKPWLLEDIVVTVGMACAMAMLTVGMIYGL